MNNKTRKAVILAAGKGTRMKSKYPKVLHKILGVTLLERVLSTIKDLEIDEKFVIVGHQADSVRQYLQKLNNQDLKCVLQEPQLGTGHAVFQVFNQLINFDGTLLILCGDTPLLTEQTIQNFITMHISSASDLSILSSEIENPANYGRIIRGMEGSVVKIVEEKDATTDEKKIKEINTGVYCLEWAKIAPAFLEMNRNNAQGEYYLTDIVEWANTREFLVNAHCLASQEEMFGINSKADLAEATKILNRKTLNSLMANGVNIVDPETTWISPETDVAPDVTILPGCYIEGVNYINSDSVIGPHVYITGNVLIGENSTVTSSRLSNVKTGSNCTIGPFAHLRDEVILSDHVRIGNFVEVKKSKINSNSNAAHLSYIGDSELGSEVNIGAGTITANYDPLLKVKSKTVLKDRVKIGSNSVLVAPVTIEEGSNVAAGSVITKDVKANSLAIARGKQIVIDGWVDKKLKNKELSHS